MKTITAVVPVRAGSTRLKNKKVAPFTGTNLLIHKIYLLQEVKEITRIVVSSDSDMMITMASSVRADIQKRTPEYCRNEEYLSSKCKKNGVSYFLTGTDMRRS